MTITEPGPDPDATAVMEAVPAGLPTSVDSPAATSNETARTLEVPAAEPAPEPAAPEVAEVQPGTKAEPHEPAMDEDPSEVRAAVLAAMADAWTAEAMAAPLGEPLIRGAATELAENSWSAELAVLAPVWKAYTACQPISEAECLLFTERLHREAHDAVNAGLREWRENGRPEVTEFSGYRLKNEHLQPPAAAEAAA